MDKQHQGLSIARKIAERACEAVEMCAKRVHLNAEEENFVVECVSPDAWAQELKALKRQLGMDI